MTARVFLLLLAVSAIASGCRLRDPSVDLLEAEIRWLEDQVYAMEDQISLQDTQLNSCRRENAALRNQINGDTGPGSRAPSSEDRTRDLPQIDIPDATEQPEIDFGTPTLPEIEFGTPTEPDLGSGEPLPETNGGTGSQEVNKPSPAKSSGHDRQQQIVAEQVSTTQDNDRVVRIVLNQQLTGGKNFDGVEGDDGILVVVEPQTDAGKYVPTPGAVSVVVLDPAKAGQSANVARWNFDVADATARLRKTLLGRGIYLDLPWPNTPPEHSRLRLYVRYVTSDGRKLDVQKDILVNLADSISDRRKLTAELADLQESPRAGGDETVVATPPATPSDNPLRPDSPNDARRADRDVAAEPDVQASAWLPSVKHDPNELPPLWNGRAQTREASGERSVVVRRNTTPTHNDRQAGENVRQATRPHPWTPHR